MSGSIQAAITSPPPLRRYSNAIHLLQVPQGSECLSPCALYSTIYTGVKWNHYSTGLPEKNVTVLVAKISDPKGMALLWNHDDTKWSSGLQYHSFQDYSYWAYKPFPVIPGQ